MSSVKYREPVLGIRDLIAPEGRVTVQLVNPRTGKVAKRVQSDNLITNFGMDMLRQHLRDGTIAALRVD